MVSPVPHGSTRSSLATALANLGRHVAVVVTILVLALVPLTGIASNAAATPVERCGESGEGYRVVWNPGAGKRTPCVYADVCQPAIMEACLGIDRPECLEGSIKDCLPRDDCATRTCPDPEISSCGKSGIGVRVTEEGSTYCADPDVIDTPDCLDGPIRDCIYIECRDQGCPDPAVVSCGEEGLGVRLLEYGDTYCVDPGPYHEECGDNGNRIYYQPNAGKGTTCIDPKAGQRCGEQGIGYQISTEGGQSCIDVGAYHEECGYNGNRIYYQPSAGKSTPCIDLVVDSQCGESGIGVQATSEGGQTCIDPGPYHDDCGNNGDRIYYQPRAGKSTPCIDPAVDYRCGESGIGVQATSEGGQTCVDPGAYHEPCGDDGHRVYYAPDQGQGTGCIEPDDLIPPVPIGPCGDGDVRWRVAGSDECTPDPDQPVQRDCGQLGDAPAAPAQGRTTTQDDRPCEGWLDTYAGDDQDAYRFDVAASSEVHISTSRDTGACAPLRVEARWASTGTWSTVEGSCSLDTIVLETRTAGTVEVRLSATASQSAGYTWTWERFTFNQEPDQPSAPSGPTERQKDAAGTYSVVPTDPDGDDVHVRFEWDDGSQTETATAGSGTTVSASHAWTTTGTYCVRATAIDARGKASDPSPCQWVDVTEWPTDNDPPRAPQRPMGPSEVTTRIDERFESSASDPEGDPFKIRFLWDDGTRSDTGMSTSEDLRGRWHSWRNADEYCVKAVAIDEWGRASPASPCLDVVAVDPPAQDDCGTGRDTWPGDPGQLARTAVPCDALLRPSHGDRWDAYGVTMAEGETWSVVVTPDAGTCAPLEVWIRDPRTAEQAYAGGADCQPRSLTVEIDRDGDWEIELHQPQADETGYAIDWSITGPDPDPEPAPLQACFTTNIEGMQLEVDASCTTDPGTSPLTYHWTWGNGKTTETNIDTWTHTYMVRSQGILGGIPAYPVTLTVSNVDGSSQADTTVAIGPTDYELAMHWAPVFYHDTAYGHDQSNENYRVEYDEMVRADFDADAFSSTQWRMDDNWEHAAGGDHNGYVYYHVHETRSAYYIGYAVFHPRDFGFYPVASDPHRHENDMETVMIMVQKDTDHEFGHFVGALTMAHNHLNAYLETGTAFVCGKRAASAQYGAVEPQDTGDVRFDCHGGGKHIILDIEHGGHGIYRHGWHGGDGSTADPRWVWDGYDFRGGDGNVYYPTGDAEVPGDASGHPDDGPRGNDRFVGYDLLDIWPIWNQRYAFDFASESTPEPFHHWGGFVGFDSANHKAHAPWAIYDANDAFDGKRQHGLWFENPKEVFSDYFTLFPNTYYDGETLNANEGHYVARSTGGIAESWHALADAYDDDGDGYSENDVRWTWHRPGASEARFVFHEVTLDPGDELEVRAKGASSWDPALSYGQSEWLAGDTVELQFRGDGDGKVDWGWYAHAIEWR